MAASILPEAVSAQTDPAIEIPRLFGQRTVHLQTVGELFTGEQEAAAAGSGLLVADDLVLTANHVVPDFGERYHRSRLDVRVGSRAASPRQGTVVARDVSRDLALVQISPAVMPTPFCPLSALSGAGLTPLGTRIYVLSYPLDEDFSVNDGMIRNISSDKRWLTSAVLNPNDSGGPAFTSAGYLVGLVVGGISNWTNLDGVRTPVFGMNYIIPISNLSGAGLDSKIASHAGSGCWRLLTSINGPGPVALASLDDITGGLHSVTAGVDGGVFATPPTTGSPQLPAHLLRSFGLDQLQAIHGILASTKRRYGPFAFAATNGYRIVGCTFAPVSVNHASDLACVIATDGKSATFSYSLESGPMFDRWRGWLNGAVVLRQERLR